MLCVYLFNWQYINNNILERSVTVEDSIESYVIQSCVVFCCCKIKKRERERNKVIDKKREIANNDFSSLFLFWKKEL